MPQRLLRALAGQGSVRPLLGRRAWRVPPARPRAHPPADAAVLWRLLCTAVDRTGADVVALSGGVDSAGLLAAVREVRGRVGAVVLHTSYGADAERRAAHRCARLARASLHEIHVHEDELPLRFARTVRAAGELVFNGAAVARDLFLERVRALGIEALLTGTGADEVLLGHPAALRTLGRRRREEARQLAPLVRGRVPMPAPLARDLRSRQAHVLRHELPVRTLPPEHGPAAAVGLRLETPYLDPDLAGWAAGLPVGHLVRGPLGKRPLRAALAGRVPADVLAAPKRPVMARAGHGGWAPAVRPLLETLDDALVDAAALARALAAWTPAREPALLRLASWAVLRGNR